MTKLLERRNQSPHNLPDEPRARAIAMAKLGHSYEEIGSLVGVSGVTIGRWVHRSGELSGNKPVMEKTHRNTLQALDLIANGMDVIEEDTSGDLALKNLMTLNAVAGTGTDKLQKESQPVVQAQNVIYVFNAAQPEAVESVEVNDA